MEVSAICPVVSLFNLNPYFNELSRGFFPSSNIRHRQPGLYDYLNKSFFTLYDNPSNHALY